MNQMYYYCDSRVFTNTAEVAGFVAHALETARQEVVRLGGEPVQVDHSVALTPSRGLQSTLGGDFRMFSYACVVSVAVVWHPAH